MKGDFQTALPYFQKSLEIMPDYAEAWYSMGITYQYLGNAAESQRCLARAKELGHPGVK
jgi:tetratricopeptide (TPR) repeat protein